MTSRKSIAKRTYPAVRTRSEGKYFTGYAGDISVDENHSTRDTKCVRSETHNTEVLWVKPIGTRRGRSAANLTFEDMDGFSYSLSLKSTDTLLKYIVDGKVKIIDGYFFGEFCQVKQGQNYFIDLVED